MSRRFMIRMASATVVLVGGTHLARGATAALHAACSEFEWQKAALKANLACEGPSSFYGYCDDEGHFIIEGIYCNNT